MRKRLKKIVLLISTILLLIVIRYIFLPPKAYTEIDYCQDIAKSINRCGIKYHTCLWIKENDDVVEFYFDRKRNVNVTDYFLNDHCVKDMVTLKKYMRQYWESNPGNVLNEKKIKFTFETEPQT